MDNVPLWIQALFEREVQQTCERLRVPTSELFDTRFITTSFLRERRRIAVQFYEYFPHQSSLARMMNVSLHAFRRWIEFSEDQQAISRFRSRTNRSA